jgi:hypothetical protein
MKKTPPKTPGKPPTANKPSGTSRQRKKTTS